MENQEIRDRFIREMVKKAGPEKAPEDFTEKLMQKIRTGPVSDNSPILSRGTWIAIFLSVAAMIVIIFTVDMPFLNQIFSAKEIQKLSLDIFSAGFLHSMSAFFKSLHLTSTTVMIIIAATGLVIIERLFHRRFSEMGLLII